MEHWRSLTPKPTSLFASTQKDSSMCFSAWQFVPNPQLVVHPSQNKSFKKDFPHIRSCGRSSLWSTLKIINLIEPMHIQQPNSIEMQQISPCTSAMIHGKKHTIDTKNSQVIIRKFSTAGEGLALSAILMILEMGLMMKRSSKRQYSAFSKACKAMNYMHKFMEHFPSLTNMVLSNLLDDIFCKSSYRAPIVNNESICTTTRRINSTMINRHG